MPSSSPRWPIPTRADTRENANFTFGTGKFGDLAGFTSAIVLAMIAILIGYESISRILAPVQIHFAEAIPIACVGLAVNIASAWLLSSGGHHHGHGHGEHHDHAHEEAHVDPDADPAICSSRYLRTGYRRASACARHTVPPLTRPRPASRQRGRTASGRSSPWSSRGELLESVATDPGTACFRRPHIIWTQILIRLSSRNMSHGPRGDWS